VPPAPLLALGCFHLGVAVVAGAAAWWLWRRVQRPALPRGLSWDCGYAAPTARMQYTAGSFAATITEWFASILRPARHDERPVELFPARARFSDHTPETVLEHLVAPVGDAVMQISSAARRLQHGRVQSYLLYLAIGVAVLAGIVLFGGGP
jgi:hydrogenase-4 component B